MRTLLGALLVATLMEPTACSKSNGPVTPSSAGAGGSGVSSGGRVGTGGSNTGGSTSGGRDGSGGAVTGQGGAAGSGGFRDGGWVAIDGGGKGGVDGGVDAASVDSGSPLLSGIGGMSAYTTGKPSTQSRGSGCGGGADSAFICPRFMLFSPEMNQAVLDDSIANGWPIGAFNYGVATLDGVPCCSCWQLVYDRPQNSKVQYDPPRPLIIQMFNTGGSTKDFDVFIGKGGMGAFQNGCPRQYSSFSDYGENPWDGGIRAASFAACGTTQATLASDACVQAVTAACNQIVSSSAYVTAVTRNSCIVANSAANPYHENWKVKARRVECPKALTEVTGCKTNPGNFPAPDPAIQKVAQATGFTDYGTTTMQDCCKPTCSYAGQPNTQQGWSMMYQCDISGKVLTAN